MIYDHEMNDFGRINLNFEKKTSFLFHLNSVSRHKVKKRQDRLYIFIYIFVLVEVKINADLFWNLFVAFALLLDELKAAR